MMLRNQQRLREYIGSYKSISFENIDDLLHFESTTDTTDACAYTN